MIPDSAYQPQGLNRQSLLSFKCGRCSQCCTSKKIQVNPYEIAKAFTYYPRWTANHFGVHRDLVRAMCMDAGEELRAAWKAIIEHGGPEAQPAAMAKLAQLPDVPEPLNWRSAPGVVKQYAPMDYMRDWILFYRRQYQEARRLAEGGKAS